MVQVNSYDQAGRPTKEVLEAGVYVSRLPPARCHNPSALSAYTLSYYKFTNYPHLHRKQLDRSLLRIHNTATHPTANFPNIPPELIQYVDNGRNPEIYTREFVELARRGNQLMKGKKEAFGSLRDVLAREMSNALPELRDDIDRVLIETGGDRGVVVREED